MINKLFCKETQKNIIPWDIIKLTVFDYGDIDEKLFLHWSSVVFIQNSICPKWSESPAGLNLHLIIELTENSEWIFLPISSILFSFYRNLNVFVTDRTLFDWSQTACDSTHRPNTSSHMPSGALYTLPLVH